MARRDRGSGGVSRTHTSLALDAAGRPHISYVSGATLKYARFDGTAWQRQTVDGQVPVGEYNSLALDAAGRPHISYNAYGASQHGSVALRYAYYDGSAWRCEFVDGGYDVGNGNSLALDSTGLPHVSYTGRSFLGHAYSDGTHWYTETVGMRYAGYYTSLALDSTGRPHISYYNYRRTQHVAYAYYDGTSWQLEDVAATEEGETQATSLVLDAAGNPHIIYSECPAYARFTGVSCSGLWYASRGSLGWRTALVDWDGGGHASLAMGPAGQPYASYVYYPGPGFRNPDGMGIKIARPTTAIPTVFGKIVGCAISLLILGALLYTMARKG